MSYSMILGGVDLNLISLTETADLADLADFRRNIGSERRSKPTH